MRIATWNINGLRSSVRRDFEPWLRSSDHDIVCLQEVKVEEDLLTAHWFDGYHGIWNSASKPGYAGVATFVRETLEVPQVTRGIGYPDGDVEGRVVTTEFDQFELINVYAPHSHRRLTRLAHKIAFLERLSEFVTCRRASAKPIILVGDLNIAHHPEDVANARSNSGNAGFLPEERAWLDRLLVKGFSDAFRIFHQGPGHYTWWSMREGVRERNVGWRLDYILVDFDLVGQVRNCYHETNQRGSDHCPVVIEIDI